MTSFDILGTYLKLFEDKKIFEIVSNGTKVPDNWNDIRWLTLNSLGANFIYSEDAPAYMYIKNEIYGAPNLSRIKHIVIDEAQDYTSIQYEIFRQLFSNCSMTILGDLNQSIHPYMHTGNYEGVLDIFNIPNSSIFKLFKSYRSIKEIVEFTKALLPNGEKIEYINRTGEKPLLINVPPKQNHEELILNDIEKLTHEGCNSIAVICKNKKESSKTYAELLKQIKSRGLTNKITLVSQDSSSFTSGIVVIPSYLSKGLEFDGVIVHDASMESYFKEDERKLFYTICTRALHKLHLFYKGNITPFIADIDKNLYTVVELTRSPIAKHLYFR
jgi:DNA helicase-2/ATP-dependent DNA helicase PcrA